MLRHTTLTLLLSFGLGTALAQDGGDAEEAAPPPPPPADVTYKLGAGTVVVKTYKDESTMASGLSHNHAIKATGWSGSFTYNPGTHACSVSATVPVKKLDVDADATRTYASVEGKIGDGMRDDVKKAMLGDDQLDADKHPNVTFSGSSCSESSGTVTVSGNLTVKGKSKPVKLAFKNFTAGDTLTGKATFSVNGSDFGLEPFSAMFGQLKNLDKLDFIVDLKGTK